MNISLVLSMQHWLFIVYFIHSKRFLGIGTVFGYSNLLIFLAFSYLAPLLLHSWLLTVDERPQPKWHSNQQHRIYTESE